jgi:hypothetical protein
VKYNPEKNFGNAWIESPGYNTYVLTDADTVGDVEVARRPFWLEPAAFLERFEPVAGSEGTVMTIFGNFSISTGTPDVILGEGVDPALSSTCAVQTWSSSQITCVVPALPAGFYHVRPRLPGHGFVEGVPEAFQSLLLLDAAPAATVTSGFGGGMDITLNGSGLGAAGEEVDIEIVACGQLCDVTSHSYTNLTCRTRELLTPETLAKYRHRESSSAI